MSVIVSNVPSTVTTGKLQEFFSFCGDLKSIEHNGSGNYTVEFINEKAVDTALLLNDAVFEGNVLSVEESKVPGEKLPTYNEVPDKKTVPLEEKTDVTKTYDVNYDDIEQEEKPKYAIMAQLLAQGYDLSDQVIDRSITFDKQHGYSTKFKSFLKGVDEKSIHLQDPTSKSSKFLSSVKKESSNYFKKLNLDKYLDKASAHPMGVKVHDFYVSLVQDAKDVHKEAKRLQILKQEEESGAPVTDSTVTDSTATASATADSDALPDLSAKVDPSVSKT